MDCSKVNRLKEDIVKICQKTDRYPQEISIVAASKYANANQILEAADCGIEIFGENKVQDFRQKQKVVGNKVKWHFIGHLQTNKVKYVVGKVDLIQSVDTLKLANSINKRAQKIAIIQPILLEVNIGDEESKYGFSVNDFSQNITELSYLSNIKVEGLMAMAPYLADVEKTRPYFCNLKKIFDKLKTELKYDNIDLKILSMGMSNDYKVAIEEGSNMVRIGSAIFRER
ncbi:MAG: YggS family pyridoxal phosphate-dependent enzyme [Actinobacteria bacterium]|nr:MAG: YggS family pyridoxal phosphate-dependent enzyme [Actinomycetota bacterium]